MRRGIIGVALAVLAVGWLSAQAPYYPPPGQWAHKSPAEAGMDAAKLDDAIAFMKAHEATSPTRDFSDQDIQDRLVLLFVNEAIRCLEEGVLQSATDGDLGAVLGLGFPPFHGGPFHYADTLGHAALRTTLCRLADAHGPRYAPAGLLTQRDAFYPR